MAVNFVDTTKEVKKAMENLSRKALREGGKVAGKAIRSGMPNRSGRLKRMVGYWARIDRKTGQPKMDVGVYTVARQKKKGKPHHPGNIAHLIEFGTKPHKITPGQRSYTYRGQKNIYRYTNKRALANTSTGQFFGKSVNHMGTKPNPFIKRAITSNITEIRKAQEKHLKELNKIVDIKNYKEERFSEGEEDV